MFTDFYTMDVAAATSMWILILGILVLNLMHFYWKVSKTAETVATMTVIGLALVALRLFYQSLGTIDLWEQLVVSVMEAIKYFGMGKAFQETDQIPPEQVSHLFYTMEIILSILAPACTAKVLASFLKTILGQVRLTFTRTRPVYYFSELNERSLTLAKSLKAESLKQNKKPKLVFCKVTSHTPIQAEALAMDAVVIDDPIHLIQLPDPVTREIRIFLIDDDEEINIQTFLKMQDKLCVKNPNIRKHKESTIESDFLVFSAQESAELIFNEVLNTLDKDSLAYDLHLINETRQVTYKLLQDYPLYEAAEACGSNKISVLVVGGGSLGTQIMKTAMICGMMESYDFSIQVIDSQAELLAKRFSHEHPFLDEASAVFPADPNRQETVSPSADVRRKEKPTLAPVFYEADVCTNTFDTVLETHCRKCNYIVVTTGDDQLNINTAQYLRRWYTRQVLCGEETENVAPLIFAAVRNPDRYNGLKQLERSNQSANGYCGKFYLFANNMEIYSAECVLERPLDTVAAMLNSCYDQAQKAYDEKRLLNWNDAERRSSKQNLLRLPVVTQHSNQITALHSLYKIQDLLHWDAPARQGASKTSRKEGLDQAFFRLARLMDLRLDSLNALEHRRWTLFHALSGWNLYPHDQLFQRIQQSKDLAWLTDKPHKNTDARLHGCMIPTEDLEDFAQDLHAHISKNPEVVKNCDPSTLSKEDFRGNDEVMCLASLFAWLMLRYDAASVHGFLCRLRKTMNHQDLPQSTNQQSPVRKMLAALCQAGNEVASSR